MKKVLLLLALFIGALSFSQEIIKKDHLGNIAVVKEDAHLHALARQVNLAHNEYLAAVNGSRTASNEAIAKLNEAINAYISALEEKQSLVSEEEKMALSHEIRDAQSLKPKSTSPARK